MGSSHSDLTRLLLDWRNGNQAALEELWPLVYEDLHRIAESHLRRERLNHTLQPTALVNEAYLRLVDQTQADWRGRAQFFCIASQMMRRILINYARDRNTAKRGGTAHRISLDEAVNFFEQRDVDLLALNEALTDLEVIDPKQVKIVELRFFGGLTIEETAEALALSPATVKREWRTAKAWLFKEITGKNKTKG